MGVLEGKVAVVTGAGGGIGREHALLLAREGAAVVVNDLGGSPQGGGGSASMADSVVDEIRSAGGRAIANHGSVTEKRAAQEMVDQAVSKFGKLDIFIANAGILRDRTFRKMDDETWTKVVDVHLHGTYLTTKAAYDRMVDQGAGGRIILTSSASGLLGRFGQSNYAAAKAGIAGLMRCLWLEGQKYGITVNLLAPTAVSRLTEDLITGERALRYPAASISPAVAFLCTDAAAEISGRQFLIAGNEVSLLSWQIMSLADRPAEEGVWSIAEIGERIMATLDSWPPINPRVVK
jgi:NAD(P)-dependent dehydrogenase (short-subunit alcohol dehydrogenase family)